VVIRLITVAVTVTIALFLVIVVIVIVIVITACDPRANHGEADDATNTIT
jgi:ABC-type cobalt transport system substrate-binding protein